MQCYRVYRCPLNGETSGFDSFRAHQTCCLHPRGDSFTARGWATWDFAKEAPIDFRLAVRFQVMAAGAFPSEIREDELIFDIYSAPEPCGTLPLLVIACSASGKLAGHKTRAQRSSVHDPVSMVTVFAV